MEKQTNRIIWDGVEYSIDQKVCSEYYTVARYTRSVGASPEEQLTPGDFNPLDYEEKRAVNINGAWYAVTRINPETK